MIGNFIEEVLNPARLAALRRLGILDTPAEAAFDRLGALASKVLRAPIALVTLVDDKRQFFKSCLGLPEPWSIWRDTPLSHSFCQHVLATDKPLVVNDARTDPLFRENLAIRDLGVVAYLGIPLKLSTGEALGSFCVIDNHPRLWTPDDVQTLTTLAMSVMTEVELRSEIRYKREAYSKIESLNKQLHSRTVELEAANGDLEAFNHSISHDLQAPIRSLKAFSQILIEDCAKEISAECQDYLRRIQQSIDRLEHTICGLSVLSGLGRSTLKVEEINLTDLAQEITGELQVEFPDRRVGTVIHPQMVLRADRTVIRAALDNLLRNAWKFTRKTDHPQVEVGMREENGQRSFFVKDNGVGFNKQHTEKLFKTFNRLHSDQEFEGSGIGLTIVKRAIQRHNGQIWADAQPNKGAIFYFSIP